MCIGGVPISLSGWPKAFCDLPSSLSNLISILFSTLNSGYTRLFWVPQILWTISCPWAFNMFLLHHPFFNVSFQLTLTHPTSFRKKTFFERPSIPQVLVRRFWHISAVPYAFSFMKAMTIIICLNVCYFHESRNYVYHVHCSEHNASHLVDNQ